MRKAYSKYLIAKRHIMSVNPLVKDNIWLILASFLLSVLIFSGPIAILINLLIFVDYTVVICIGLGIFVGLAVTVAKILFYNFLLNDNKIPEMKYYYLFDAFINVIVLSLMFVIMI